MTNNSVFCIIRYGEIALKGMNRSFFEKKLVENLKHTMELNNLPFLAFKRVRGRILIEISENGLLNPDYGLLSSVFGVCSLSFAHVFEMKELEKGVDFMITGRAFDTFRITTKRVDSSMPKCSGKLDKDLGAYVCDKYHKKVSLDEPELNLHIELISGKAFMFLDRIEGIGGLPYGIEGKTIAYIGSKQDKLAALLMMKRGCSLLCLVTGKVDAAFTRFGVKPKVIEIKNVDEIDEIARKYELNSMVSGHEIKTSLVLFLPLVGMNKKEIDGMIGSFGL